MEGFNNENLSDFFDLVTSQKKESNNKSPNLTENTSLDDLFTSVSEEKKKTIKKRKEIIGDVSLDNLFSSLSEEKKKLKKSEIEKKQEIEQLEKEAKAFESFLYSESTKEKEKLEEKPAKPKKSKRKNNKKDVIVNKIKEKEEINEKVDENLQKSLDILDKLKRNDTDIEKEEDPALRKLKLEVEQLRKLVESSVRSVTAQGGGGEVRLEFLDDIDRDTAKNNGKFLKYDSSLDKWVGANASGGAGSQTLNETLGLGNTSSLGLSVGIVTTPKLHIDPVGSGFTFTEDLVVQGNARVTGILSIGTSSIVLDSNSKQIRGVEQIRIESSDPEAKPVIIKQVLEKIIFVKTEIDDDGVETETEDEVSVGIGTTVSINTTGIITAAAFSGSGSALTGVVTSIIAGSNITLTGGPSGAVTIEASGGGNGGSSGITIKEEGTNVGTAGSVASINFVGNNITASAVGSGATITFSDTPQFSSIIITNTVNNHTIPSGIGTFALISDVPTNNNQLTNGAGYITTSFTNTNQLTNDAGFITSSDNITGTATGLSGVPDISVSSVTATSGAFSGNVTIGGTLTYEDVTNIDSIGLVTARFGVNVTGGQIIVGSGFSVGQAGVVTASSFVGNLTGSASSLSGVSSSFLLDYNNFSNTPTIPTNNNQLTNGAGYITTSFTNTNQLVNGAGFITTSFTNTNQLVNGAGFITTSFTNTNQLVNGAGFITGVSTFSGDYNNLTNTPTIPTNNNELINGAGYITTSFTNTNQLVNGAGFITTSFTNTNQLTNGAGFITTSFTNTNQLVNGAGFITASDDITGSASSLSGVSSSFLLDYNNFTNTPTISTNTNQLTNGAGFITTSFTNTNQLTNGAGFITTSFTNTNQLTNGAGFITASDDITGTAAGLSGNPNISVTTITGSSAEFTGNVTIGGTLTYSDVTNIDSLGIITARSNVVVGGELSVSGISTFNDDINVIGHTELDNVNVSGVITATKFSGSGDLLTSIPNGALDNSSVSFGGVSVNLGSSDATPAFDLSDATNYPTSSLSGTITNAQLAGGIANHKLAGGITNNKLAGNISNNKLANSTFSLGGVTVALGGNNATPAFDLSDATNYPTSSLSGTITNAQLAGSIADNKLASTFLKNVVDDTTPQLGGNLDLNSNNISGSGTITATNLFGTTQGQVSYITATETLTNKTLRNPTFESGANSPEFLETRFANATQQNFVQLYTGNLTGSYFTQGEYQKVVTITPSGNSQNYTFIIRLTATSGSQYQIVTFTGSLRSNTLPDLSFTSNFSEEHNGTRFIEPKLWTKETTTAGFILVFEYIHTSSLFGGVNVEATIIPRSNSHRANVVFNTTQSSEQSSIDTGFTENDPTLTFSVVSGAITASTIKATAAFYPPSYTTTQRDAGSFDEGAMIYNSTTKKIEFYNGTSWNSVSGSGAGASDPSLGQPAFPDIFEGT